MNKDFRRWLQAELTQRCRHNPHYSLRAFSLYLKMDPSSVSKILSGKRRASTKVVGIICERLGASPVDTQNFLQAAKRRRPGEALAAEFEELAPLDLEAFATISDWYHIAILEMTEVIGFKNDPMWISRCLGVSVPEVRIAIERLIRLGLVVEENRFLKRVDGVITNFKPGMTSVAHRLLQRQLVAKAAEAIDNCPPEDKDITAITMAIDPTKIQEARKRIQTFRRDMSEFLQKGSKRQVYTMAVQLYPISKIENAASGDSK